MSESNKALVRRIADEVITKGNFGVLDETLGPDYVYREPTIGEKRGKNGLRELITMYRTAFPDLKMTIEEQAAEGDKVFTRWTATGTHRGELMGFPPTGKIARVQGMIVTRIVNGKVVEDKEVYDALGMLRQIGALPTSVGKAA